MAHGLSLQDWCQCLQERWEVTLMSPSAACACPLVLCHPSQLPPPIPAPLPIHGTHHPSLLLHPPSLLFRPPSLLPPPTPAPGKLLELQGLLPSWTAPEGPFLLGFVWEEGLQLLPGEEGGIWGQQKFQTGFSLSPEEGEGKNGILTFFRGPVPHSNNLWKRKWQPA